METSRPKSKGSRRAGSPAHSVTFEDELVGLTKTFDEEQAELSTRPRTVSRPPTRQGTPLDPIRERSPRPKSPSQIRHGDHYHEAGKKTRKDSRGSIHSCDHSSYADDPVWDTLVR
eukprot:5026954-Pyramimonas_sp.AAC.1